MKQQQRGQSATEYLVALIVVMFILGVGVIGEKSVIITFLDAIKEGFDKFSSFLSLP